MNELETQGGGKRSLSRFRSEFNHFFDLFGRYEDGDIIPKIEVRDEEDKYLLLAELPGVDQEDIDITLNETNLVIEGEKRQERSDGDRGAYRTEFSYGSFYRSIPISNDVDIDAVTASFGDGLLEIVLKKKGIEERTQSSKKVSIERSRPH